MVNKEAGLKSDFSEDEDFSGPSNERTDNGRRTIKAPIELAPPQPDKSPIRAPLPFELPKVEKDDDESDYFGRKVSKPEAKPDANDEADEAMAEPIESPAEAAETAELARTDQEEDQHLTEEIAAEHREAIAELDPETAELFAEADKFLEAVANGEDQEVALSQQASELGMGEDEIAAMLAEGRAAAETDHYEADESERSPETTDEPVGPETMSAEAEDDDEAVASPPPSTSTADGSGGSGSGRGGSGGGSGTPPPSGSPSPPPASGGPLPSSGSGRRRASFDSTTTVSPLIAPNLPPVVIEHYDQRRHAGQLLLVGLVGYLIGRRRGRIRTERKLLPVQKQLEKRVSALEQDITFKEQQLVAAKARQQERLGKLAPAAAAERTMPRPAIERTQPGRQETRLGMEKPTRAEHLGHMIVTAEAPRAAQQPEAIAKLTPESVKTLQREELLAVSDKIVIEGASLRKIYESHLIGEKQLRHLVSEHLRGKDIRKDLRQEMVEHEIDFERDPILRDRIRSQLSDNRGSGGIASLLASAGIVEEDVDPVIKRKQEREAQQRAEQLQKQRRQRVLTDSAMATAITVLAVIVAILLLRG